MSIYKHNYRSYTGRLTPAWYRIVVLARYGFAEVWSSKITVALFIVSLLPSILFLFGIYLANNPLARVLVGAQGINLNSINERFFLVILQIHCWLAMILSAWIAPRLISFDLADNALPILLSRPISRVGYVSGKFIALLGSLSAVTWVPCLLLFCYQSYSSALPWAGQHLSIATGLFVGALIWIGFLSILGLAVSSWVKWRMVATGVIFAAIFIPAGVGAIVSGVLRTKWGFLLNVPFIMSELWGRLLGTPPSRIGSRFPLPTVSIAMILMLAALVCMAMLNARIRAREVVRG
jgi:ABC-type transport system involved in multi-copper enzyme maturation permease subunit